MKRPRNRLRLNHETIANLSPDRLIRVHGGITVTHGMCVTHNVGCTWADCPTVTLCN